MKHKPTALTLVLLASTALPAGAQTLDSGQTDGKSVAEPVSAVAGNNDGTAPAPVSPVQYDPATGTARSVDQVRPSTDTPSQPVDGSVQPVAAEQNGASADVEVSTPNGLEKAIADATKALEDGAKKTYTIKITTKEAQQLPPVINAKGKIVIIGMGNEPAGVGAKKDVVRTALTPAASEDHGTEIKSPVEISGVEVKGFSNDLFKAAQALTITNSVFEGTAEAAKDEYVVKSDLDDTAKDAVIDIRDSSFSNTGVIEVDDGEGKVTVKKNVINHTPSADDPTIDVDHDLDYPATGAHTVQIEGNEFTSTNAKVNSAHVRIARPDVTVHNNTFTLTTPEKGAAAVMVFNPDPKDGVPLKNVKVTYNRFNGGTAVANHLGTALPPNALSLNQNDFSKADDVLPKGKDANDPLGTKTPADVIDATKNFWGDKKTDDVAAKTTDPLKEYTPPKDGDTPTPPPGGGNPSEPGKPTDKPSDPGTPGPDSNRKVTRMAGETRFETAVQISKNDYKDGAKAVILARGDVHADSVSAVPLAEELDAPVLLTQTDSLHPEAAKEIQRLLPKGGKVIFMGGTAALSKSVEDEVTKLGGQVERIAGENRAGTAVETANYLQKDEKVKELLIADGTDWQADLIAGPAAAEVDGATLLTNGDQMAPETQAFLAQHSNVKVTAIGDTAIKAGENPAPSGGDNTKTPTTDGAVGVPKPSTDGTVASESPGTQPVDSAKPSDNASSKPGTGMVPVQKSRVEANSFFAEAKATASPSPTSSTGDNPSASPSPSASASDTPPGSGGGTKEGVVQFTNKLEGKGTELSLAVAKAYFKDPKAVGVATTDDFADALAGGAQISEKDGPILLTGEPVASQVKEYLKGHSTIKDVFVYGGPTRLSDDAIKAFTE